MKSTKDITVEVNSKMIPKISFQFVLDEADVKNFHKFERNGCTVSFINFLHNNNEGPIAIVQ